MCVKVHICVCVCESVLVSETVGISECAYVCRGVLGVSESV